MQDNMLSERSHTSSAFVKPTIRLPARTLSGVLAMISGPNIDPCFPNIHNLVVEHSKKKSALDSKFGKRNSDGARSAIIKTSRATKD